MIWYVYAIWSSNWNFIRIWEVNLHSTSCGISNITVGLTNILVEKQVATYGKTLIVPHNSWWRYYSSLRMGWDNDLNQSQSILHIVWFYSRRFFTAVLLFFKGDITYPGYTVQLIIDSSEKCLFSESCRLSIELWVVWIFETPLIRVRWEFKREI